MKLLGMVPFFVVVGSTIKHLLVGVLLEEDPHVLLPVLEFLDFVLLKLHEFVNFLLSKVVNCVK